MLDLDKLEKELDRTLEKETKESLNAWLWSKRGSNYDSDGEFDIIMQFRSDYIHDENKEVVFRTEGKSLKCIRDYSLAA